MTLAERIAAALARPLPADAAILAADLDDEELAAEPVAAAVLIAITDRPEPGVILTQRHAGLRAHAGQVSFPGGRIDPGDADAAAAALREAWEEIGLDPAAATVVGAGDPYRTGTGYLIAPVVAVIPPDLPLVPNPHEVDAIFEPPLAFLLDPANRVSTTAEWRGRERRFWDIGWQERRVWGATAAMIANLSWRLRDA
ncbi:MAG: CoA pyrophosphatase [Sphingomonas fennica]